MSLVLVMFHACAMGTKRIDGISDCIRFGRWIYVECRRCGREVAWHPWDLSKAMEQKCTVDGYWSEIERRLKCLRCGARRPKVTQGDPPKR